MTEQAFIDSIDCQFPYRDGDAGRRLVLEACELSVNAAFAVLDELANPGASADAPTEIRQELVTLLERSLNHPLVPILVPIARRLVAGGQLSVAEALGCMNAIRSHAGQYSALGLAYMSCDDVNGEADLLYEEIKNAWQAA